MSTLQRRQDVFGWGLERPEETDGRPASKPKAQRREMNAVALLDRTFHLSLAIHSDPGQDEGATIKQIDADEQREPPPDATPVTFPQVESPHGQQWNDETPPPNFQSLFTRILKPTDISETHLKALNIEVRPQCSVEELLPLSHNGSSYLPSMTPPAEQPSAAASYADATKADPGPARKRKEFDDRLAELRIENTMAYRAITRNFKQGVKPPRLAYMRVFWQGLESMSQYWDCTLDQYYTVEESDDGGEKSPKRQKLDAENDEPPSKARNTLPVRTTHEDANGDAGAEPSKQNTESSTLNPSTDSKSSDTTPAPRSSMRYKGLRTNSGRYMPDQFRVETVRGFVEGTVWPSHCNVHPPRMMPLVHFNKLKLPVRQSVAVYRLPTDRARARQGGIVGPVLGVQVRPEIEFGDDEGKARLDVMREIGGLLQLAQERAREGKKEVKPGEGKWWTTVPRWGGGPGGEVESQEGNSDIVAVAAELLAAKKDEGGKTGKEAGRQRQKKTPAMLWKELRCGFGYFDSKTDYAAIGKDPASDIDEVFLVSSLNHHIAILKLSVHRAYIEYLLSGALPQPLPQDTSWCRPTLQRSRWFDLFVEEDRVEAFRGLWGVMAYLTREVGGGGEGKPAGGLGKA